MYWRELRCVQWGTTEWRCSITQADASLPQRIDKRWSERIPVAICTWIFLVFCCLAPHCNFEVCSSRQIWSHHNICGRQPSGALWWSYWRHRQPNSFSLALQRNRKAIVNEVHLMRQIHHHSWCFHAECPTLGDWKDNKRYSQYLTAMHLVTSLRTNVWFETERLTSVGLPTWYTLKSLILRQCCVQTQVWL